MMKKGSSLLLALLMLLAALTGCSAGEDNSLVSQTPFPEFSEVDTGGKPGKQRHLCGLRRHHRQLLEQRLRHLH